MKKLFIFAVLIICSVVVFGQRRIHDSLVVDQRVRVGTTLVNTDGIQTGTFTSTVVSVISNTDIGGTLSVAGTASTKTLTVDGSQSVTGYLSTVGPIYADSSFYFGDDKTKTWRRFAYQELGSPSSRLLLENLSNISVQDKAGTGQVIAIQRDTTGSTVKINLPSVLYINQDCTHTAKALISDSLGLRLKSADGVTWKIQISPTGVITAVKSAAP